jgi:predicted restriction endonuclease
MFTLREWLTLKRQYGYRCVACLKTETELALLGRKLVPDHIEPLVKGGLDIIENLQPLCHGRGGCNNRKGGRYMDFVIS